MNTSYVKEYDENGVLTNPINGSLKHNFPNRKQRRLKADRFSSNSKSTPLVVSKTSKYLKRLQIELDKEGKKKYIYHYQLV